jgi:AraC-like DNA-binding protein
VLWNTEFVRLQLVDEQVNRGVAEQTGFAYSHYLQAAFKSEYGQTPGEFRHANSF